MVNFLPGLLHIQLRDPLTRIFRKTRADAQFTQPVRELLKKLIPQYFQTLAPRIPIPNQTSLAISAAYPINSAGFVYVPIHKPSRRVPPVYARASLPVYVHKIRYTA